MNKKSIIAACIVGLPIALSGCIDDAGADVYGDSQMQGGPQPQYYGSAGGNIFTRFWENLKQPHPPLRAIERGPQHWQRRVVRY